MYYTNSSRNNSRTYRYVDVMCLRIFSTYFSCRCLIVTDCVFVLYIHTNERGNQEEKYVCDGIGIGKAL